MTPAALGEVAVDAQCTAWRCARDHVRIGGYRSMLGPGRPSCSISSEPEHSTGKAAVASGLNNARAQLCLRASHTPQVSSFSRSLCREYSVVGFSAKPLPPRYGDPGGVGDQSAEMEGGEGPLPRGIGASCGNRPHVHQLIGAVPVRRRHRRGRPPSDRSRRRGKRASEAAGPSAHNGAPRPGRPSLRAAVGRRPC